MRALARHSNHDARRPGRARRRFIGVTAAVVLGLSCVGVQSAAGQDAPAPGKGNAYAQGFKVDPQNGQLSFGITYGQALAGHQNIQAIAESRSLDLGVIGVTLAAEGCDGGDPTLPEEDQPQPLVSRTDEEGGRKQKEENGVQRSVNTSQKPLAEAIATVGGTPADSPITIGGTDSRSTSGIVDGRRLARAVTDVADVGIPGVLEITGMRWVAEYQTEPTEEIITRFSIESVKVADTNVLAELNSALGGDVPLLTYDEPIEEIDEINALLEPLGISIHLPEMFVESGIAFVQPLTLTIAPSEDAIGDVFTAIQPVREALTGALLDISCSFGSLITIGDIVLGSVSGAGTLNLEFGGVTATSGDIDRFKFPGLPELSAPPPLPSPPPSFTPTPDVPDTSFDTGTTAPPVTTAPSQPEEQAAAPEPAPVAASSPLDGVRGGPLLGVGLGVLALLGALAEGDRRKMRKAQKAVPLTVAASSDTTQGDG